MEQHLIAKLESLIDRLLAEYSEISVRNEALLAEREHLLTERNRVQAELQSLLTKLDLLEDGKP
ncbi:MAG: hypothetical protein JRE16_01245 [Deltaproteobacteria bacterium]|nr:hypothetical protein [Deltaproteobacteria bacterium]MBW2503174.1 hypothetical protein [Deltaproteobacteria bacterium]MBW2519897.1 hypothetical protein [Deltaproteobacteria bacterium]